MCVLLLIVLVPAAILFGVPLFGIFFGVNSVAIALDKKKHGDRKPITKEERDVRLAMVAILAIVAFSFFLGFLCCVTI